MNKVSDYSVRTEHSREDECGGAGGGLHLCWPEGPGWAMKKPSCPLQ